MKTISSFTLFFMIACILPVTVHANSYQYHEEYLTDRDTLLQSFCNPLTFTRSGIKSFLKHTFNRKEYAVEFLPHNFSHFIQFLEYGKASNQNSAYLQASLRLFTNKLKAVPYVSADALADLVEKIPDLIPIITQEKTDSLLTTIKTSIKRILYKTFLDNFSFFKKDPDTFFDQLTTQIVDTLEETDFVQGPVNQEILHQQIMRFLELALTKVIWSPLDQEDVWTSFKLLSKNFVSLVNHEIINEDDVNDLLYSLVERFVHFLNLTGSDLSYNVIDIIKEDLASGTVALCTVSEQEDLEPKISRLHSALRETEAKIYARKRGIITEVVPLRS